MAITDRLLDAMPTKSMMVAQETVYRGIEFLLNAEVTKEQLSWIDLERLDISDPSMCVLGQLFQGYDIGLEALGLYFGDPAVCELGFCGSMDGLISSEELTDAWREQLGAMREND